LLQRCSSQRFYRGFCDKFEKIDGKFQSKLGGQYLREEQQRYNLVEEQRKVGSASRTLLCLHVTFPVIVQLSLLNERKDVLTQLISIQNHAKQETHRQSSRSSSDRRPSTASSTASYATFSSENLRTHNRLMERPEMVPKLNFSRLN
jgi:hypothetical protein